MNKYQPRSNTSPIHLYVVVLCGNERGQWVHPLLNRLIMSWHNDPRIKLSYEIAYCIHPVDAARNRIVEEMFLPSDADVLLMIDNDIVPQENILDGILSMPGDIFIAPYFVWDPKRQACALAFGEWIDEQMVPPTHMKYGEWFMHGGAGGTGCIAIKRRVFTEGKLTKPFFKIIYDDYIAQKSSEDIYFTAMAKKAGYTICSKIDYVCSHYHTLDLAEVNLGMVNLVSRFINVLKKKYGDIGVSIESLSEELKRDKNA